MAPEVVGVLVLVLCAEFVNGWTDAPNAIATVVSTRSLKPWQAVLLAAVFNLLGALSGTAVAMTIGKGIVDSGAVDLSTVGCAMFAIVVWSTIAAQRGIPTSETHALVAGLAGAALATGGTDALLTAGWVRVLIGLVLSSVVGFFAGLFSIAGVLWLFRRINPERSHRVFRVLQIGSSAFMAFSHGSNDGQKFMGAFTLALVLGGVLQTFAVPLWVILLCAVVMSLGTSLGGWKIIRTLGVRLTRLRTHEGFAAEMAAATTITLASFAGIPLSTTHTISTSIMGVGRARGPGAVHWVVTRQLAYAWIATFPICAALGWGASLAVMTLKSLW